MKKRVLQEPGSDQLLEEEPAGAEGAEERGGEVHRKLTRTVVSSSVGRATHRGRGATNAMKSH